MKIQGRLIVILAVLGLLAALVPLATAGAVTGTVTLDGGYKGMYFSDRPGKNVVTIDVKDADLSPVRVGTARSTVAPGGAANLVDYYVSGEKSKTDNFHGKGMNGPCDISVDPDGAGTTYSTVILSFYADDCPDGSEKNNVQAVESTAGGVLTELTASASATTRTITLVSGQERVAGTDWDADDFTDETYSTVIPDTVTGDVTVRDFTANSHVAYRVTLTDIARDRQAVTSNEETGVAIVNENDVSVTVNGSSFTTSTLDANGDRDLDDTGDTGRPPSGEYYEVNILLPEGGATDNNSTNGGGIQEVILHKINPQDREDAVVVSYKVTEFDFTEPGSTPLTLTGTSVKYNTAASDQKFFDSTAEVDADNVATTTINYNSVSGGTYTVVRFGYNVKDSEKGLVTLNSPSAGDVVLDANETSAVSSTFRTTVAIFSQDDYNLIAREAKNADNAGDDKVVQISELNDSRNDTNNTGGLGHSKADNTVAGSLFYRIDQALEDLDLKSADAASKLVAKIIPGKDGDIITANYSDTNPVTTVADTAKVDMAAPKVELINPTHKLFTNATNATFRVEVTDEGAGVDDGKIVVKTYPGTGIGLGDPSNVNIASGFQVTVAPTGSISEGEKKWFVGVEDRVGNQPPTAKDKAPTGAGSPTASTTTKPFVFTVDTRAPQMSGGKTGVSLNNPGVVEGTDKETEKKNQRTWVRVDFNVGDGKAPLDAATVTANDFRVGGVAPLDAKVSSVDHECTTTGTGDNAVTNCTLKKGTAVYLQVGQLDTDAKPRVDLVGEIKDKAGNIRTEASLSSINDGISPVVTVMTSTDLDVKEVTLTISSSENLQVNPVVTFTIDKPTRTDGKMNALTNTETGAVALQSGTTTTWTSKLSKEGLARKYYAVVTATDVAGNMKTVGHAANEDDFVSFQLDGKAPSLKFVDSSGNDLKSTKQEEGAVWIVMEFDEDEHGSEKASSDKYRKVNLTSLTLKDTETDEDVPDVGLPQVFAREVNCVDHDTSSNRYSATSKNNKCAEHILAVDLMPGMYKISVAAADTVGNEVKTGTSTEFQVIAKTPFELLLRPGQNFISIPGMPMGESGMLDNIFSDEAITIVRTYDSSKAIEGMNPWLTSTKDPETGMFGGDITMIEAGKAYFVSSAASVELEVKLQAAGQLPPTISVRQGWNSIGFWSPSGDKSADMDKYLSSIGWTVAYSYDPTPGMGWTVTRKGETELDGSAKKIEEGKGYLVYALYDSVLTP